MAVAIHTQKQNDLANPIQATLKGRTGAVQDLTGAVTVVFSMRLASTGVVKVNRVACVVMVAAAGTVEYRWTGTDTNTVGIYDGEFEVTYGDNKPQTFPSDSYIKIVIVDDIA